MAISPQQAAHGSTAGAGMALAKADPTSGNRTSPGTPTTNSREDGTAVASTGPDKASTGASGTKIAPRVGTLIQRSDAANRKKQQWLLETPPPPPRRTQPASPAARPPPRKTLEPARVMGPLPPPPISVEAEPGVIVEVPHFAVHVARRYKARVGSARYHMRFNGNGTVRSCIRR